MPVVDAAQVMAKESRKKQKEWFWLEKRILIWPLIAIGRLFELLVRLVAYRRHGEIVARRARRIGRK